jgi:hypothetical protein
MAPLEAFCWLNLRERERERERERKDERKEEGKEAR